MLDPERLSECITWIDLSFVERRRIPDWAIQVGIRYHLAGMSLRDASQFLDELGVQRSHVAVHEWVHKADLQPSSTVTADQLAVDEKMIRLHGQDHWLYSAVDPQTNRNSSRQSVSDHSETDDAMVSRRVAPPVSTR